jgi:hypothetical protein
MRTGRSHGCAGRSYSRARTHGRSYSRAGRTYGDDGPRRAGHERQDQDRHAKP